jgi:hypothetical protein
MDWHESDQSEEEIYANNRKRSSRGKATLHLPSPLITTFQPAINVVKPKANASVLQMRIHHARVVLWREPVSAVPNLSMAFRSIYHRHQLALS